MKTIVEAQAPAPIEEQFLQEYSADAAIRKYTKETAGQGISYLLEHEYGKIYLDALAKTGVDFSRQGGVRLLEFGCGGGMNLVHLVSMLDRKGIPVNCACGTDFSEKLIEAANREAGQYLSPSQNKKVAFCVAKNENLVQELAAGLAAERSALLGTFHLILGVNTFRYCKRLNAEIDCARGIFDLLAPGGICVMIDMNQNFPMFRSRFRDRLTKEKEAYYLPSLDEYANPFAATGFEILRKGNFCWIPHSAGSALTGILRALTPVLNSMVPSRAMRSLVVARKPGRNSVQ